MARGVFSTTNYLVLNSGIITATPLTIACWVKPSAFSANQYLAGLFYTSAGSGTALDGWTILLAQTSGNVQATCGNGVGLASGVSASGASSGSWNHVAAVFNSATSRYAYLNGTAGTQNTTNVAPSTAPDKTAAGVLIREDNSRIQAATACHIAELGFWNVALSGTEIAQLAAGYSPLFVRGESLFYYKLLAGDSNGDEPEDKAINTLAEQGTVSTQTHPTIIYPKQWQTKLNQSVNRSNNF